jgi:hypothetical protein
MVLTLCLCFVHISEQTATFALHKIDWLCITEVAGVYCAVHTESLYSTFGKSPCTYKRCWKWCPRALIQAWNYLTLFAKTFCRSACEMFLMHAVIAVFNSLSKQGLSQYTAEYCSLSAQWLSECTVSNGHIENRLWRAMTYMKATGTWGRHGTHAIFQTKPFPV